MKVGSWEVNVSTSGMPQSIATAFAGLNEMVGAEYKFIAYLGSQIVNGTNHAVLAEQTLVTGKDTKNVVVVFFRETKDGVTVSGIERVVESGGALGGVAVDVKTDIPDDANAAFASAFEGFLGCKVSLIALLATQVTKGTDYVFVAETEPVVENPEKSVELVIVNALTKSVAFVDLLTSKHDTMSLGYAFTWLKQRNTSMGAPLGEWP